MEYVYRKPNERSRSNGIIRPYHSKVPAVERLLDGFYIYATLWTVAEFRSVHWHERYSWLALAALLLYNFFAEVYEVYHDWRGAPMYKEAVRISIAWFSATLILISGTYIAKTFDTYSHTVVSIWALSVACNLIISHQIFRLALRYLRKKGKTARNIAILGSNELGLRLANAFASMPWLGHQGFCFYDDRSGHENRRLNTKEIKVAGGCQTLFEHARNGKIDTLYITLPLCAEKRVEMVLDRLADTTVSVYFVPDLFVFNLLHSRWTTTQGIPTVSIYETPFHQLDGLCKRMEDIVLGALILLIFAIPMALIAIGVKMTSPGPIFFKQRRYGIRGQTIEVLKFRTMRVCEDGDNVKQATRNDSRVTKFGKFLRSSSLDELPQFINVLQGTMSIVGPRPHAVVHNELYRKDVHGYMLRHKVKPGITGLAQINGCRGEINNEEMMERRIHFDLEYIRSWSLMLDFKIIMLTAIKGMFGKQAY
jgi:putative colanic acid biosynthesis UDP-glucose lipid carrier transferase